MFEKSIEIIPFEAKYHEDLRQLSFEWLEKYVFIEPEDLIFLDNPQRFIDEGGYIWMARFGKEIVGTISLLKNNETTYELNKFAVTEKFKGLKIGMKLMDVCMKKAKILKAKKVILYSNHKLEAALKIYEKYGFKHVSTEGIRYEGADVKMELIII